MSTKTKPKRKAAKKKAAKPAIDPFNRQVGAFVRALRKEKGWTGTKLAAKVDLTQAQLSRLENGFQGFRSHTLRTFAQQLGVKPFYLYMNEAERALWDKVNGKAKASGAKAAAKKPAAKKPAAKSKAKAKPKAKAKAKAKSAAKPAVKPVAKSQPKPSAKAAAPKPKNQPAPAPAKQASAPAAAAVPF